MIVADNTYLLVSTLVKNNKEGRMGAFIIAEIGINHNGDVNIAKKLIKVAKEVGCNAVKFQKRDIDLVYSKEVLDSPRESPWGTTQRDQKRGLEFGQLEFEEIDRYCRELGIEWFASAWDINSLAFLDQFDCRHAKVASAMLADEKFLREVARRKRHTFISTGLSDMALVERAVGIFREEGCEFTLMHCVGTYPMKAEDANLRCIQTLREKFDCPVGYSGHESGLAVSYGAAALGITALERHITLDRSMYGSDHAASVEPNGLRTLVGTVRKIQAAMGDGVKRVIEAEKPVAEKLRAHIIHNTNS
jgi:N-acetylneuraminate synthase